jgi:hypothetical protein
LDIYSTAVSSLNIFPGWESEKGFSSVEPSGPPPRAPLPDPPQLRTLCSSSGDVLSSVRGRPSRLFPVAEGDSGTRRLYERRPVVLERPESRALAAWAPALSSTSVFTPPLDKVLAFRRHSLGLGLLSTHMGAAP